MKIRRPTVHSDTMEAVRNVITSCDEQKWTGNVLCLLDWTTKRAGELTNNSKWIIPKIRKRRKQIGNEGIMSASRKKSEMLV